MPFNHLILCHLLLLQSSRFPSIRGFLNDSFLLLRGAKRWSLSFSISPSNEYLGLTSSRIKWFEVLAVQGTLKSLLQHCSLKASIFWRLAFFVAQLSHPYMTTGKTEALTVWKLCQQSDVSAFKYAVYVCYNFPSKGQAPYNFPAVVTTCGDFGAQEKKMCHCSHFSPSTCHEVMGPDAMIFIF